MIRHGKNHLCLPDPTWKAAVAEINGAKKQEDLGARRALGITKEVASLQQTPPHGDFAVVYVEANDVSGILRRMMDSTDPFNTWFKDAVFKECHGMDASSPLPPDNQTMIDLL